MNKFRYYIYDHFVGKYWGTNNEQTAIAHSLAEDFSVLDTEVPTQIIDAAGSRFIEEMEDMKDE